MEYDVQGKANPARYDGIGFLNKEEIMNLLSKKDFLEKIFDYEKNKQWKYQGETPCVIDIHDDTCPPCLAVAPILEELNTHYNGAVMFYKIDTRKERTLAQELGVRNLPTLVFCPINEKPVVIEGAASKEKLMTVIDKELLKKIVSN
jgi:predicted DsbA family dithiol-disulfide isomerase